MEDQDNVTPAPEFSMSALGAAIGAAFVGAIAWWAVAHFADYEIGLLAWGIGGLVGFATVAAGGRGVPMAVCAAALALLAIGGGKLAAAQSALSEVKAEAQQMTIEPLTNDDYEERKVDARDWVALGADPTGEEVQAFLQSHHFVEEGVELTEEEVTEFRAGTGLSLAEFDADQPSLDDWNKAATAEQEAFASEMFNEVSIVDIVKDGFEPIDLLFAALGIMTAWGLVTKAD